MSRLRKNPELMMQLSQLLDQRVDADDPRMIELRDKLNHKDSDSKDKKPSEISKKKVTKPELEVKKSNKVVIKPAPKVKITEDEQVKLLRENKKDAYSSPGGYESTKLSEVSFTVGKKRMTKIPSGANVLKITNIISAYTDARERIDYSVEYVKVTDGYCQYAIPQKDSIWSDDVFYYSVLNLMSCGVTKTRCGGILKLSPSNMARIFKRFHHEDTSTYRYKITNKITDKIYLTKTASDAEYLIKKVLYDKTYRNRLVSDVASRITPLETRSTILEYGVFKYELSPKNYIYSVEKGIGYETDD